MSHSPPFVTAVLVALVAVFAFVTVLVNWRTMRRQQEILATQKSINEQLLEHRRYHEIGYTIAADGKSITCHRCGRTSYAPGDVQHLWCDSCGTFHARKLTVKQGPAGPAVPFEGRDVS